MSVLLGILVLGFVVTIHELGHLIVAKAAGMAAPAFSVGFGPVLFSRKWRGTDYRLSVIPLGGYVLLDPEDESFQKSSLLARVGFFLAGPVANLLLSAVLFTAIGHPEYFLTTLRELGEVLYGLFSGRINVNQLSGPVGIVKMAGETAAFGLSAFAVFVAFLSMNLAILNLLPLPILDGGQILIVLVEGLLRRPLHIHVRVALAAATWLFLLGLFAYVTAGDISRIVA